jgi:hypothetical protein
MASALRSACTKRRRLSTLRPILVLHFSTRYEVRPMSSSVRDQFAGVLEHLERNMADAELKCTSCQELLLQAQAEKSRLAGLIDGLKKQMESISDDPAPQIVSKIRVRQHLIGPGTFAHLSMRWAICFLLGDIVATPLSNEDIAVRLKTGGFNSPNPVKFRANVNAVLSRMAAQGELVREDKGYCLSPTGQSFWQSIKHSEKFIRRNDSPNTMFSDSEGEEDYASAKDDA